MNEYQKKMKSLSKLHENLVFCLEHIGLYGALYVSSYLSSFFKFIDWNFLITSCCLV